MANEPSIENLVGRTGGPYLDLEEAKAREIKSARIEDREPDFSATNLFPMVDHTVNIPVDPSDPESVDSAREKINELISPSGTVVNGSTSAESPLSSPVLAAEAGTDETTPNGQVKTQTGVSDDAAVEEEVKNNEDLDVNNSANADTTADTNTLFSVDTEAPSSNPEVSDDDPFRNA